jgi:hypothetical protein
MAAANLADQARLSIAGILTDLHDLDQDFKWSDKQLGMLAGWRDQFDIAVTTFKRPVRAFQRKNRPVLI